MLHFVLWFCYAKIASSMGLYGPLSQLLGCPNRIPLKNTSFNLSRQIFLVISRGSDRRGDWRFIYRLESREVSARVRDRDQRGTPTP
jgi:hypothetical protein